MSTWPRIVALRAVLLMPLTLSACGDDRAGGGDDGGVAEAVHGYLSAVADRDGKRACRFLTPRAQRRVFTRSRAHAGLDHPLQACASVVKTFEPLYGRPRLKRVTVSDVEIDGDRASARADGVRVRLERVAGDWKLTSGIAQRVGDALPRSRG